MAEYADDPSQQGYRPFFSYDTESIPPQPARDPSYTIEQLN